MAMTRCRECGNPISTQAPACPKCGCPNVQHQGGGSKTGRNVIIAVIVACVLFFAAVPFIGVVAAIAIPSFLAMQLRAKRAEAPTNLDGIRTAMAAAQAEGVGYQDLPPCPAVTPGRLPADWTGTCASEWSSALGWAPAGLVRCQYQVVVTSEPGSGDEGFEAYARCDLDGDGNECEYRATESSRTIMITPNNIY